MLKVCIECGAISDQSRCPRHRANKRNGSTRQWRRTRDEILIRDGYCCHYCGKTAITVDHVRPKSLGGSDDPSNLVAACADCNRKKGANPLSFFEETRGG